MASEPKRNAIRKIASLPMSWDYGIRAARALDVSVPGPHRDKTIARALNVTVRMAQYLREGKHWTVDRLNQASKAFTAFDAALVDPDAVNNRINEIEQELSDIRLLLRGRR